MKRTLLGVSVLAGLGSIAACGGASPAPTPIPSANAGGEAPVAPDDPTLASRAAFSNGGGMWLPTQMTLPEHQQNFERMGVALEASKLADPIQAPLGAVVSLGGCTGSFVSPKGLMVTNHHCVQRALQFNTTEKENLVQDGFLAKTTAEERSAGPAQRILVAQAFRDVTREMTDGLEAIADPARRHDEAEARHKKLVSECEKDRPGIRCQISTLFGGAQHQLIESLEIRDVRLVYAPRRSIGNYGGEVDNWAWPRHTGDFSYYRAYVGKDGKPADYAADNVPFQPAHHLKVSTGGLKPHDFVMVTGYPAATRRTTLASEVRHRVEWELPYAIESYQERYAMLEAHLGDPGETGIKAGVAKQSVQNGLEKSKGILAGLKKGDLLARKDELDAKIKAWAAAPANAAAKTAIERYEQIAGEQRTTARQDFERRSVLGASSLFGAAHLAVRLAEERAKPDAERKAGYQERDMPRVESAQKQFGRSYDRVLDRAGLRLAILRAARLPEADRPWLSTLLGAPKGKAIDEALVDKTLDGWYAATKLEAEATRLPLVKGATLAQLKASKDPFVQAALRVHPLVKAQEKKDDAVRGELLVIRPRYVEAMRTVLGGFLAPDANGTLRVTYGTVKAFERDAVAEKDWPFTVAKQLVDKDKGKAPFDAPGPVLEAIKAKKFGPYADDALGGELPVDFLSDVDITGGNSGSPTLNGKGELVGLAFDGTIEGVASDAVFDGKSTRAIHVDARYMLWVMDSIDHADHLLEEMGVKPSL